MWLLGALLGLFSVAPITGVVASAGAALLTNDHTLMNWASASFYLAAAAAMWRGATWCYVRAYQLRQRRVMGQQPTTTAWIIRFIKSALSISKSRRLIWFTLAAQLFVIQVLIGYYSSGSTTSFDGYVAYLPWSQPLLVLLFMSVASAAAAGLLALLARNRAKESDPVTKQHPDRQI